MNIRDVTERIGTRRRALLETRRAALRPSDAGVIAVACGLLGGFFELGILSVGRLWTGSTLLGSLQLNEHYVWMIPVTHVALALAAGSLILLLFTLLRIWSATAFLAAVVLPGTLAPILLIPGLARSASVALAIGLSIQIGGMASRANARLMWFARWAAPMLLVTLGAMTAWQFAAERNQRRQQLAALPPAPATPNVLLIVMDTVRADHTSLLGYHRDTTPSLRKLAERGVNFDQARAPAPWTLPTHASIFTGRWPHELSVRDTVALDATYPTLAGFLSSKGYATAGFVANTYYCNAWWGLARGFMHYEDQYEKFAISPREILRNSSLGRAILEHVASPANTRPIMTHARKDAAMINRDFLRWLDKSTGERPFFAFLNYFDAHDPYIPPDGFRRGFGSRPRGRSDMKTLRRWFALDHQKMGPRILDLGRDSYDECIGYLDEQIGRLLEDLDRRGVLENTLVVVTSDHGEELGEHGLFGHGLSLYDAEIHVPLVIAWPKSIAPGVQVSQPVSLRNIAATVVDALGLEQGAPFPGDSLTRFWSKNREASGPLDPILSEVSIKPPTTPLPKPPPSHRGPMWALIEQRLALIRNGDGREEVYDFLTDRAQQHDIASPIDAHSDTARLRVALDTYLGQKVSK